MNTFIYHLLIPLTICVCLTACGEKAKEAQNAFNNLKNLAESAENMQEELEEQNEKLKERKARGDTIAMHYEELAEYLPKDMGAYQSEGDPEGSTSQAPGMGSVSAVSQRYVNENGDQVVVELVDYVGAFSMYTSMFSVYAAGFEVDNADEHLKGFTINENIKGWQIYHKKTKKAEVNAGIAGRFMLIVEADNQPSINFVKEIITEEMRMEELAKM